jgi:hypothetical protein
MPTSSLLLHPFTINHFMGRIAVTIASRPFLQAGIMPMDEDPKRPREGNAEQEDGAAPHTQAEVSLSPPSLRTAQAHACPRS